MMMTMTMMNIIRIMKSNHNLIKKFRMKNKKNKQKKNKKKNKINSK